LGRKRATERICSNVFAAQAVLLSKQLVRIAERSQLDGSRVLVGDVHRIVDGPDPETAP